MKLSRVLFLGFSNLGVDLQHYYDDGYSIWTMNDYYRHWPDLMPDRIFNIHQPENLKLAIEQGRYPGDHRRMYNESGAQIVTRYFQGFENEKIFPLEMALEIFGQQFFVSTVSYMFALAIMEQWQEIVIEGVHLTGINEHARYIPGTLRNIDAARARNIEVHIPLDCSGPEIVNLESTWREQAKSMTEDWKGIYE